MIKFLDLKLINKGFEAEFKKGFKDFLNSGHYILGEQVSSFENEFSSYCGTDYCVGVSNGLDAIRLILEAYKTLGKLSEGDEILVPANTYIASVLAISNAGLKPILVEPNPNVHNIDITKIEGALSTKTKAVLGVHLYGQLYDVEGLERICKEHNLLLIEDAAQAHGARFIDERMAGNLSDIAAFSFYPTKNLGALGDAGAITTNNKDLADTIFKLRNYGRVSTYKNDLKGYNCRLDELQASFLRKKLKVLDAYNSKRREIARNYIDNLDNTNVLSPNVRDMNQHVFYLFVIRSKHRNALQEYLLANGVETLIHYPIAVHKQRAYKEFENRKLPVAEQLQGEVLSLPLYPGLRKEDVSKIVTLINSF